MKYQNLLSAGLSLSLACSCNHIKPRSIDHGSLIMETRRLFFSNSITSADKEQCLSLPDFLLKFLIINRVIIRYEFEKYNPNLYLISNANFNNNNQSHQLILDPKKSCLESVIDLYIQNKPVRVSYEFAKEIIDLQLEKSETERFDTLILEHSMFVTELIDEVEKRGLIEAHKIPKQLSLNFLHDFNQIEQLYMLFNNPENPLIAYQNTPKTFAYILNMIGSALNVNQSTIELLKLGEEKEYIDFFKARASFFEDELRSSVYMQNFGYLVQKGMIEMINPDLISSSQFPNGIDDSIKSFILSNYSDFRILP